VTDEALQARVFALTREAARRTVGMRPFDVQVVAGLALSRGTVVEMQTGEGKTLAAVMPAAFRAMEGRGVHVLTFNDYLARRDAEWMGPIYRMLGLSVGAVQQGMSPDARRAAYRADVTYVTAKEAGFDHLRDLLAMSVDEVVHRGFHCAIVDEADSLLIDEARVPLVIAGGVEGPVTSTLRLASLIGSMTRGVHYVTDEYGRNVELTDFGIEYVEQALGCGLLHDERNIALLTAVNCALHAQVLLKRDADYIVRNKRIEIVDELTGRVVHDRHWPDGLQAALEAKEGLAPQGDGRILGTITLQHFLRGYSRLCGMTGTARSAAAEIAEMYDLPSVVIPTHLPMIRVDHPDVLFTSRDAKEAAVVDEIRRAHATGRPVLAGTLTVAESERLAARLQAAGVPCQVLNARNDAMEADVVARAGALGAVTISTNMAGRGTDIRLGGADEGQRDRVVALGGLYVIGTNRHESLRVDLQLRGRSGRQGDPGESRFFVSLEDDLLVRYGIAKLIPPRAMPPASEAPIENAIVRREVARAQRIIEGQDLEIRRTLSRYSKVIEQQRQLVMERRQALLTGEALPDIWSSEPKPYQALVARAGEHAVRRAELTVTLHHIDRLWREQLAFCADLREGIHLVTLGGQSPLTHFTSQAILAFRRLEDAVDQAVLDSLSRVSTAGGAVDLSAVGLTRPSSTWTYIVNDDPFKNQLGRLLTGPGGPTIAIYTAVMLWPLLLVWRLVDAYRRRQNRARPS
jgi:preprotein translocase subunit SecA